MTSLAPFSDAARGHVGPGRPDLDGIAVILSSIGALNGWTLLMGQVPMAAARDGCSRLVRPPVGAGRAGDRYRGSRRGLRRCYSRSGVGSLGFAAFYTLVVGLSTMTAVIPYAFCALAVGLVAPRVSGGSASRRVTAIELLPSFSRCSLSTAAGRAGPLWTGPAAARNSRFVWQRRRTGLAAG